LTLHSPGYLIILILRISIAQKKGKEISASAIPPQINKGLQTFISRWHMLSIAWF